MNLKLFASNMAKRVYKEYFRHFLFVSTQIIIATHAPLIVNGAELFSNNSKIFKSDNFTFKLQHKEPLNVEEMYYRFFDINTPENRFLSQRLVRLLNLLVEEKITLSMFDNELEKIERMSYDFKQIQTLSTIKSLAKNIVSQ